MSKYNKFLPEENETPEFKLKPFLPVLPKITRITKDGLGIKCMEILMPNNSKEYRKALARMMEYGEKKQRLCLYESFKQQT